MRFEIQSENMPGHWDVQLVDDKRAGAAAQQPGAVAFEQSDVLSRPSRGWLRYRVIGWQAVVACFELCAAVALSRILWSWTGGQRRRRADLVAGWATVANLTGINNGARRIDRVCLGAVIGIDSGTRGTYYFDAFESRRGTYIRP